MGFNSGFKGLNHDIYNNHDRVTKGAEFLTLLLRIMRVPGSNLVPDPATGIAPVYLITMQAGVAKVFKITACRHTCKHSRFHYALLTLSHNSAFYNYRVIFHKIGLSHQRPTSFQWRSVEH